MVNRSTPKRFDMERMYFYIKDGQQYGPVNYEQLVCQNLSPNTLVWCYGIKNWIPIKELSSCSSQTNKRGGLFNFRIWLAHKISPESYLEPRIDKPAKKEKKKLSAKAKRTIKILYVVLISLLIIAGLSIGGYYGYNYYQYTYLPQKYLNEACADLESKWANGTDEEKLSIAIKILSRNPSWEYPNVVDDSINNQFASPKSKEAFKFIEDNAFAGLDEFQFTMGQIYAKADNFSISTDYTKAAYWWNEAAKLGNSGAMANLGWAYLYGRGVNKDEKKALYYFQIAANLDNPFALYRLGCLYESGISETSSYYDEYYTPSTKPDYPDDIFIRTVYHRGRKYKVYKHKIVKTQTTLKKDINKAIELWKKAAALGWDPAKEKLQHIYEE